MEIGVGSVSVRNVYREVVQAVLLFGVEPWFLLVTMSKNMEGLHVGFLR